MKHNVKIAPERRRDKTGEIIKTNVPIMADIRFNGKRMMYFTGYRIDIDKFDNETQLARKNSTGKEGSRTVQYNEINNRIKAIKAKLELYFQSITEGNNKEIKIKLDEVCKKSKRRTNDNSFFSMFDKYIENEVALSGKNNVKTVYNYWKKYEAKRRIILSFDSIKVDTLKDFEKYLKNESTPKSSNTINRIMKTTRAFWNYSKKELKKVDVLIGYPFGKDGYQLPGENYGKPIYITKAERDLLYKATLSNERLQRVRDIFVFQCLVGARVGDLFSFTKANITEGNVLSYIPRKTKEGKPVEVTIPLHPMAIEILNRYDIPGRILPFISRQRYNDYIKELFEAVGITRKVTRLNPRTHKEEHVRICDIASSHMARRAFIGNLYGKIDTGVIISMTGHVKDSKAFTRYYDVAKELQQEAINKL